MKNNKHHNEICSRSIKAGHRVYFVDAKVDQKGNRFISISEVVRNKDGQGGRERHRVHIYEEDLARVIDAMGDVLMALKHEDVDEVSSQGNVDTPHSLTMKGESPTQIEIPSLDDILSKEDKTLD